MRGKGGGRVGLRRGDLNVILLICFSYYADPEAGCQLYHVCYQGNKFSQLCPNGTIFHQGQFACSNWRKVDCSPAALQVGDALVTDFAVEREFVTLNLDVSNPLEELPWRNRDS